MSTELSNREVVEEFMAAGDRGDLAAMSALLHEDMVMEFPQSGERFTGRANAAGAMEVQEVKPEPAGEGRMVGEGDIWVVMMPLRYGEDSTSTSACSSSKAEGSSEGPAISRPRSLPRTTGRGSPTRRTRPDRR